VVDLAAVVRDVRLDLEPLLQSAGAELEVNVQAAPTVLFSEKNLRSVVFNLLSNALKYRAPDRAPRVRLRARPEGEAVVLEVQDNGLGLDAASEQKLFGMFQRFHDHVEGSGIGLYMVKKMVENAGGRIVVRTVLGSGTTFSVYFNR
jgi:signal transduction histidine kinase